MASVQVKASEVPLADISTMYHDEMKKIVKNNMHVLPQALLEHHKRSVEFVLEKCSGGPQSGPAALMETLFKKYQTQNDINLNSGRVAVTPAIGIDLGTTYCCVAVHYHGKVIIIPNQKHGGQLTTPSYVSYDSDGSIITVGTSAKETAFQNPTNTIYDAKRIIGRAMDDEKLQGDMKTWPFSVVPDEGTPKIKLTNGTLLYPEQVSAELLKECRDIAEDYLQLASGTIKKAVITVPAYFEDGQRRATLNAGKLAGLEVLALLNEPTAAGIAYSLERLESEARKVLIFDMGGGTFDVAVLDVKLDDIEVLGVFGDTHLGGEDFDNKLLDYCAAEFKRIHKIDLLRGKDSMKNQEVTRRMKRMLVHCERAKKVLSCGKNVNITVDAVTKKFDLKIVVTREKFEELVDDHFKRSIEIMDAALKKAGVSKENIDDVVLVGGSTRIPRIQQLVSDYFGGKILNKSIHPDHAVAYGAAIKAAMLNGQQTRTEMGRDNLRIQDVTPFSLGIYVIGGNMSVILPKNSKIPAKQTKAFHTINDFQVGMAIKVYQGEDFEIAVNNKLLGEFSLKNIPPAPKGKETIDVTMKINEMGILEVTAVIRSTKGSKKIIIGEDRLGMSKEAVKRLSASSKSYPAA